MIPFIKGIIILVIAVILSVCSVSLCFYGAIQKPINWYFLGPGLACIPLIILYIIFIWRCYD